MISLAPLSRCGDHMYLLKKPGGFPRESYRIVLRKNALRVVYLIAV